MHLKKTTKSWFGFTAEATRWIPDLNFGVPQMFHMHNLPANELLLYFSLFFNSAFPCFFFFLNKQNICHNEVTHQSRKST